MGISLRTICKNIIGLASLPITAVCILSFFSLIMHVQWLRYPPYLLLIGFTIYLFIYVVSKNKSFAYVLGHEVLHAVASMFFGGKLLSIFISRKNGSVSTTKDNFIISLIPYCIPFYGILLALIYYGLSIVINTRPLIPTFIFLLGMALAHHCILTVEYIKIGQSDIAAHGTVFSLTVIVIANIVLITFLLGLFLEQISFTFFWHKAIHSFKVLWREINYYKY